MAINPYQSYTAYQNQDGMRSGTVDLGTLLYPALEQNIRPEVLQGADFDISPYTSGVEFPKAGPFGYYQFGQDQFAGQQTAGINQVLQNLYAANPGAFKEGFNPYSSFADWNARQNTRPGFNEGAGLADFVGSIPGELFRVGGELASEPGVQALALAAAGGSMLGGGAAGAAPAAAPAGGAAGGTGLSAAYAPPGLGGAGATSLGLDAAYAPTALGGGGASVGLAGAAPAGTALAPGFFASETATPGLAPSGGTSGGPSPTGGAGAGISLGQIAAGAIPAAFGAFGANQQANQYGALANQYMAMGAPYRSRLSELYSDPEDWLNSPEVQIPVQQGTNILARSLSTKGNPMGSGNALQELQNYASKQLFDRLGSEKDRLAGFGGLSSYSAAAPQAASAQIGAQKGIYDAIGAGAADIFNPPRRITLQDLMRL